MPLLGAVAGTLTWYAAERGAAEQAARMLGATDSVRGGADPTEPMTVRLTARLSAELGADRFAQARAEGRALDRAEAIQRLDPRLLATDSLPSGHFCVVARIADVARLPERHARRAGRKEPR
jgi:hypothetical protein